MQNFSDYLNFNAEDFAADESFQSYVYKNKKESADHWEQFLLQHPEKRQEMERAAKILTLLIPNKVTFSEDHKERERLHLSELIRGEESTPVISLHNPRAVPLNKKRYSIRMAIAASIAAILLLAASVYFYAYFSGNNTINHTTAYGGFRSVVLPDGTTAILNGNSTLSHSDSWDEEKVREVWLKGEAFFTVTHQRANAGNAKFVVHAGRLDVEVLGTEFNVYNRDSKVKVILNEGKVNVALERNRNKRNYVLAPGESIEYFQEKDTAIKKMEESPTLTSWKDRVLILEDTPLGEIARMLKDVYGFKVVFEDPSQEKQKISGTLPSRNVNVLLNALSKTSNLEIVRKGDEITLRNRVKASGTPENEKQSNK